MTGIDFYFDFASPYGFIAAMQVERLARPVRWHPFLLGAVYKKVGAAPAQAPFDAHVAVGVRLPRAAAGAARQVAGHCPRRGDRA